VSRLAASYPPNDGPLNRLPFNSEDSESNRLVKLNHIRIDVFTSRRLSRQPYGAYLMYVPDISVGGEA